MWRCGVVTTTARRSAHDDRAHDDRAHLDRRNYPIGRKVSDKEFSALRIERDEFHGDWNYVIRPREKIG